MPSSSLALSLPQRLPHLSLFPMAAPTRCPPLRRLFPLPHSWHRAPSPLHVPHGDRPATHPSPSSLSGARGGRICPRRGRIWRRRSPSWLIRPRCRWIWWRRAPPRRIQPRRWRIWPWRGQIRPRHEQIRWWRAPPRRPKAAMGRAVVVERTRRRQARSAAALDGLDAGPWMGSRLGSSFF